MNKLIFAWCLLFLLGCVSLFALNFGGTVDNSATVTPQEDLDFSNTIKSAFMMSSSIGSRLSFNLKGSIRNSGNSSAFEQTDPILAFSKLLNLETFKLDGIFSGFGNKPSQHIFSAGRFNVADFTSYIFAHPIDGLSLGFHYMPMQLSITVGYTGLLWKDCSAVYISNLDTYSASLDDVVFGPPRLIAMVEATLPLMSKL